MRRGEFMTLDEAIACTKEISSREFNDMIHCIRCSEIHGYIADWLEDYKRLCTEKEQDIYERAYRDGYDKGSSDGRFFGYNQAIIDFAKRLENKKYLMKEIQEHDFCYTHYDELKANYVTTEYFEEQLKAGGE